jgi:putative transposase
MARLARLSITGLPHLLQVCGHNGQAVFHDALDVQYFQDTLREAARQHAVAIHAYALLANDVRLLLTPEQDAAGLSRMMQAVGRRYCSAFNRRHTRTGSLWEGRFRATVIEPEVYLLSAMRWLEGVEAELPKSTPMASSRTHHCGEKTDPLITDHPYFWSLGNTPFAREAAYQKMLVVPLSGAEQASLLGAIRQGWPLGSEAFLAHLALNTGRRLSPLARGRPLKYKV